jgi:hypothetical protein
MSTTHMTAPDGRGYFIKFVEAGPQMSALSGSGGAATELLWHVRDSVRNLVHEPMLFRVRYRTKEELSDAMFHNDQLIVSDALRTVIEPWLKDFEFFRVRVELNASGELGQEGGGGFVEGYWWLNSWRRLDLVDWERSDMSLYPLPLPSETYAHSPVRAIKWNSLVLRCELPDDEHFFGIAHIEGEQRYLSDALWRHLSSAGLRITFGARMFGPGDPAVTRDVNAMLNSRTGGA